MDQPSIPKKDQSSIPQKDQSSETPEAKLDTPEINESDTNTSHVEPTEDPDVAEQFSTTR